MIEQIINWVDSLSAMERFFIVYFGVLFILWLWKKDSSTSEGSCLGLFKSNQKYELAVNKKAFICEVVKWGLVNLPYEGAAEKRKNVSVEVSYYPHKKLRGTFSSLQKKIMVYVNNHPDVDELIDTSLHEVVHHLQYCADKKNFEKRYSKLLKEKTYAKHPMEVEARKLAASNLKACKIFLIETGKLKITT